MSSLPFPVRVAAGLVVTAVEEVRDLPRTVVGLPITAVSQVLQLSMRAQQVVTELAIKGDTALEGARPVEDAPSWARFDDDFDDDPIPARTAVPVRRLAREDAGRGEDTSGEYGDLAGVPSDGDPARNGRGPHSGTPPRRSARPGATIGEDGATAAVTPDALPGYETMTIAQLRGRLRSLSLDQVTELLAWESAHADRPPYVTMLSNRITTLTAEQ